MNIDMLINGSIQAAASGRTWTRTNPMTRKTVTVAPTAGTRDTEQAVEMAAAAGPAWLATGPAERRRLLNRAADLMDEKSAVDELIADAKSKGGTIVAGGRREGTVVSATLIDGVTTPCGSTRKSPSAR